MFHLFLVVATLALLPAAMNTAASFAADFLDGIGFILKLPYWLVRGLLASPRVFGQWVRRRWELGEGYRRSLRREYPRRGPVEYQTWLDREFPRRGAR